MVINLRAVDADRGAMLSTETRVHSIDKSARRRMRLFWPLMSTTGELMRRELLAATARAAFE